MRDAQAARALLAGHALDLGDGLPRQRDETVYLIVGPQRPAQGRKGDSVDAVSTPRLEDIAIRRQVLSHEFGIRRFTTPLGGG